MPITVRIGAGAHLASVTLELDMRKSMNGDLMIFDHGDVDIIISTKKNKVVVFPKDVDDVKSLVRFASSHKGEMPKISLTASCSWLRTSLHS